MNTNRLVSRLLASTIIFGAAAALTAPAHAQNVPTGPSTGSIENSDPDVSAEGEPVDMAQDIVVTGSRIPQPNLTSASPITVLTSEEARLSGATRTEDLINALPQAFAAQGSNIANGASGTATVNLRGLGTSRTLVLVNGRRLMAGDPLLPVADINFIPALAVQRVDVLTGGASSVYGADAVSGVVNFIMDTNFEGLRLDAQYSLFDHVNNGTDDIREAIAARGFALPSGHVADGGTIDLSAMFGVGFADGRGNITAYATYRDQKAVMQGDRDYSACAVSALSESQAAAAGRLYNCGGSGGSYPGSFLVPGRGTYTVGPNGTFIQPAPLYNYAPANHFQRPDERYTFGLFANYELSEAVNPYLEAMFMDDRTNAQIAPGGTFNYGATNGGINCDNPLLSAQQRGIICAPGRTFLDPNGVERGALFVNRRNIEGGPRIDDLQHTSFRVVGGVRGDVARGLSYDTYYQFGRTNFAETYRNELSGTRIARALDVVRDNNGRIVCRSAMTGEDPNCVPYDVFTLDRVSPQALAYLSALGFQRGNTQQAIANASVTALLGEYGLQSPWASAGLALNVGAEYRKESLEHFTDEAFSSGDLTGQGGPRLSAGSGELSVKELFGEIQIPLISDRPFFDQLELRAGYRRSSYDIQDSGFDTNTYKLEGEWAPIRDIRLRASYNRAVRAPNILELFGPQAVGLGDFLDLCAGPATGGLVNGLTAAQCANTGVTAAQFGNILENPADQYNIFYGGNPDLQPEVADSYTYGVVLQPSFLPRFALSVDYFNINLRQAVGAIPESTTFSQCVSTGDPFFCRRINRDALGTLWLTETGYIEATTTNVGGVSTRGIDVNASYSQGLGSYGDLSFSLVGTHLLDLNSNPLGDIEFDCTGYFLGQCGTPNPEWRHKLRVTYTAPNGIGLSAQWRHFSAVENAALSDDEDLAGGTVAPGNRRFGAQNYLDLVLRAKVGDNYTFRLGANNILDRDPPIAVTSPPSGSGNTYPQVYDALGRYVFAGVTLDF